MASRKTITIRSNGEPEARAYACLRVPAGSPEPPPEDARVVITDPRRAVTRDGSPIGGGPRNPEQKVWRGPRPPGVELPDARPLTKAQRFWIDPELLAAWEQEEDERKRKAI